MARLTKQEIINKSITLFGQRGVDATSLQDIADACVLRKASLYSHFNGRDAIVTEAYKYALGVYHDAMLDATASYQDAPERINAMLDVIIDLHDQDSDMFRFLVMNQYSQIAFPEVVNNQNVIQTLKDIIDKGKASRDIKTDIDSNILALSIAGVLIQQSIGIMFKRLDSKMARYRNDIHSVCSSILGVNV